MTFQAQGNTRSHPRRQIPRLSLADLHIHDEGQNDKIHATGSWKRRVDYLHEANTGTFRSETVFLTVFGYMLLVSLLVTGGCGLVASGSTNQSDKTHSAAPLDIGALADLSLAPNFYSRQKVTAHYRKSKTGERQTASFEAIVEKDTRTLNVVGLTPFGTRAFFLSHKQTAKDRQGTIEIVNSTGRPLPFYSSIHRDRPSQGLHPSRFPAFTGETSSAQDVPCGVTNG